MSKSDHPSTTGIRITQHGQTDGTSDSEAMDIDLDDRPASDPSHQPNVLDQPVEAQKDEAHKEEEVIVDTKVASRAVPESEVTKAGNSEDAFTPLLLCREAHPRQQPHPSQDLIALYGLQPLAATVARTDPITGEKINKMRRSYEGQVKSFGLAGRNKATKHEDNHPGGLVELIAWPEEEWHVQKVVGKEIEKGLPANIQAKLEKALKLEPGPVPRNDEWESILGLEKLKQTGPGIDLKSKDPSQPTKKVNGNANGMGLVINASTGAEAIRPKRSGRKRRYDEHSFEGYGEGYVDDDGAVSNGGYSSGEGSRISSSSKKKRKKDYSVRSPPTYKERTGSYGPGSIHAISAYGR